MCRKTHQSIDQSDLKPHIISFVINKWQERWSSCPDNKLFRIKPTLGEWPPGFRNSSGHTYFSHSYILRQEDPPECTACQEIYSVRHVLIDCIDLGLIRPRFYTFPDMKTLFETVSVGRISSFVKEVNFLSYFQFKQVRVREKLTKMRSKVWNIDTKFVLFF